MVTSNKVGEVRSILENSMGELYALYFSDHSTKTKEVPWLNQKVPEGVMQDGRLDNEFGTYMREHLYRVMNKRLSNNRK